MFSLESKLRRIFSFKIKKKNPAKLLFTKDTENHMIMN